MSSYTTPPSPTRRAIYTRFQHPSPFREPLSPEPLIDDALLHITHPQVKTLLRAQIELCIAPLQMQITDLHSTLKYHRFGSPEYRETSRLLMGLKEGLVSVIDAVVSTYSNTIQQVELERALENNAEPAEKPKEGEGKRWWWW